MPISHMSVTTEDVTDRSTTVKDCYEKLETEGQLRIQILSLIELQNQEINNIKKKSKILQEEQKDCEEEYLQELQKFNKMSDKLTDLKNKNYELYQQVLQEQRRHEIILEEIDACSKPKDQPRRKSSPTKFDLRENSLKATNNNCNQCIKEEKNETPRQFSDQ